MQDFIHRKNLENWRKLLTETADEALRMRLSQLIADEEATAPSTLEEQRIC